MNLRFNILNSSRAVHLFIIILMWAAIYLPQLGGRGIGRNEGRRMIPAVEMVKSGDWVNPDYCGTPYYRKPPMINWMIASSFTLFGNFSEFTARLPIALLILFTALMSYSFNQSWFNRPGAFILSAMILMGFGMIERGRTATIESVYTCWSLLAVFSWLSFQLKNNNKFIAWIVPMIFLGLGMLTKGPLILLVFYVFSFSFLKQKKQLKQLIKVPHLLGLTICVLIFCSWWLFIDKGQSGGASSTWSKELLMRLNLSGISFSKWLSRFSESFIQFLPWLFFIFAMFNKSLREKVFSCFYNDQKVIFKAGIYGFLIPFALINLMPLAKPRYTFPVLPSVLLASSLVLVALLSRDESSKVVRKILSIFTLVTCSGCFLFFMIATPLAPKDESRVLGQKIRECVPVGKQINVYALIQEPFMFYVADRTTYLKSYSTIAESVEYVLLNSSRLEAVKTILAESNRSCVLVDKFLEDDDVYYSVIRIEKQ